MNNEKHSKPKFSAYVKYSAIGMQMAVIIALFTYLGSYLDTKNPGQTPWWTLGLSLFGVIASLVLVIKEVIRMSNRDEK